MAPSSITERAREFLQHYVFKTRANLLPGTIGIMVLVLAPTLPFAYADYHAWLLLEPGGVPHNIIGWIIQTVLKPITKEPFSTACYTDPKALRQAGPQASTAFLKPADVPQRAGDRPTVGHWVIPHRQLSGKASAQTKKLCQTYIASLAQSNPSHLAIKTSLLERHGPALFVTQSLEPDAATKQGDREIAHMHEGDGSVHVMLAPQDAKLVIDRGWGQRHGLSGRLLYSGYIMVYAARDGQAEELDVVQAILRAGVSFMLGAGVEKAGE